MEEDLDVIEYSLHVYPIYYLVLHIILRGETGIWGCGGGDLKDPPPK